MTVREGHDFATDVLHDAWDFAERRDIGWEQNFRHDSIYASGGVWSAVNEAQGGWLMPLYPGHKDNLYFETLPGDLTLPKFGYTHRIDTVKYTHLSYRLRHSDRSVFAVYWEDDESKGQFLGDPSSPRFASNDGYYHNHSFFRHSGWHIYAWDMRDLSQFEQHQGKWTGSPFALRLDPSVFGAPGAKTEIDWIRLVDPDSAPAIDITWNTQGASGLTVITVYVDTKNSGRQGSPIAHFTSGNDPGLYRLHTALLPPGDYYFYVSVQNVGTTNGPVNYSSYSSRLRITHKPRVTITAPSAVTGVDYATSVVGNPWDMDGSMDGFGDVANLANCKAQNRPEVYCSYLFQQFSHASFLKTSEAESAGTLFSAYADPPLPWHAESDVQVHLNVSQANPINPAAFRYLTYRLKVDESNHTTIADKLERGWVSRPVYWNLDVVADGGRAKAHIVYEGWNTYVIDLWHPDLPETVAGFAAPTPWTSFGRINNLRIDPLETDVHTAFALDWVKLTAENHTANGKYTIQYRIEDPDSSQFTVEIYRDTNNSGFSGTKIATITNVSNGTHSYTWDASNLAEGTSYWIYIKVSDGLNTTQAYSTVPIRVGDFVLPPIPVAGNPPLDFDGDGVSDHVVYRPAFGQFYQNRSSQGLHSFHWGGPAFIPLHADIDGDQIADPGLLVDIGGVYFWYFRRSSDGGLLALPWGITGDAIALADYNGDGRDEIAVWRDGLWFILHHDATVRVEPWGMPGDVPVPADYDGDGRADIAIWRPSDGTWWIINSGFASGLTSQLYTVRQWGLAGDIPLPADWFGDRRAHYAVWRPADGTWYLRHSQTDHIEIVQWGLPGDIPVVGDFNGNGTLDLTVYRDQLGMWFHNFRNGVASAVQFGLPGDLLPVRGSK